MFTLREWGVLYAIVGFAYSLLIAWRCGKLAQPITKDIVVIALAQWFWPYVMVSYERHEARRR